MSAPAPIQDYEYLYASHTNVSNFVSVKLSGNRNYNVWKSQMLCLLDSNNMGGIVDPAFVGPRYSGTEIVRQYDSLAKGWILGSVNEDVLADVHNLGSAKAVWEKLKSIYDPAMCLHEDSISDEKTETEDVGTVAAETNTIEEDTNSVQVIVDNGIQNHVNIKNSLREATINGNWTKVESLLKRDEGLAAEPISSDGSTVLHIAVEIGHNDIVKTLLSYINDEQVLKRRDSDGSTALHIAAIVGNKDAADLLVKKNRKLLRIKDCNDKEPLQVAYEYMHLHTIGYLMKAVDDEDKTELQLIGSVDKLDDEIAVRLLINAISAKDYSLASELVPKFPVAASKSDEVLMALTKTFPSGLDYWETLIYPPSLLLPFAFLGVLAVEFMFQLLLRGHLIQDRFLPTGKGIPQGIISVLISLMTITVLVTITLSFLTVISVVFIVWSSFLLLYNLCWEGAKIAVPPIKHIQHKKKEWDEAEKVLELVCDIIGKCRYSGTHHPNYTRPILEAARCNAFKVVDEILKRSNGVPQCTDKNGYDFIQLAIINRSERIYNRIYDIGKRKNIYRTTVDSSKNNILHLVGRLAPSSVLNQRTGAALQLQRELQWREEVKKLVSPAFITEENIFKETPDMIFTREHKELVKEGEKWMKTTAESCSITAALITTIVFAAAITVPGGSNQDKGTPLFKNKPAFIVFAISDAISLFASSTALLVFLSILTARFSENDFLVSLPRRLFIGLFSLLLSTTTMMVAFGATLFLVFCDGNLWMLAPICGLAFIPIAFFVGLQFPLMMDLLSSTYLPIFGKYKENFLTRVGGHILKRMISRLDC